MSSATSATARPAAASSSSSSRRSGQQQSHSSSSGARPDMASRDQADARASADGRAESEPLLGSVGDASQRDGEGMLGNLVIGTAVIAQAGIWILTAVVWGSVLTAQPIILFHAHPLLNSAGILLVTQAILVLQPTHTAGQKITGTYWHSALNNVGLAALIAGLVVIEYNKGLDPKAHWHSVHAYLGVTTYAFLGVQALVGATAFFAPALYGGVGKAKSLYKYHRLSGYFLLVLMFVTVGSATFTDFNVGKLHVKLWAVIVASVITLVGVLPRVRKVKLGL